MQNLTLEEMVKANWSHQQVANKLGISYNAARKRVNRLKKRNIEEVTKTTVSEDLEQLRTKASTVDIQSKYRTALQEIHELRLNLEAQTAIKSSPNQIHKIQKPINDDEDESTAVIVASDWHVEENVVGSTVSYLNEFNMDIAQKRIDKFAENTVKLLKMFGKTGKLKKAILALLGDFISGYIHDELVENNELAPVEAAIWVKDRLISVIQYILDETEVDLTIICKCGNHGRTTQKTRFSTERGNSLEFFIYDVIEKHFISNKRVKTIIDNGYHTYFKVYDVMIRFHHGHAMKYNGGVGGVYIPVHKAIDSWNKGIKADLDVFGHWHQLIASDRFILNGSLIGYGPYALSIKAGYEPPRQAFFLVNSKYGKTITTPIFLED